MEEPKGKARSLGEEAATIRTGMIQKRKMRETRE